ncbi:MAG TPA: type IIL restriction-modification enzyme MmeI, partial [Amycolatopsis sp.]|nr:type IIL restriction-modification enzyme MmeI [Amycolatopsis sp.]
RITATPVASIRDVEHKARLLREANAAAEPLRLVADALTGAGLRAAGQSTKKQNAIFVELESGVWADETNNDTSVLDRYAADIQTGRPAGKEPRRPLHWPLIFPEVFSDTRDPGFDAVIGNPAFLGGKKISGTLGDDYLAWLATWDGHGVKGHADLAARFVLRATGLLNGQGQLGYVTTNTLVEGDTLEVGLLQVERAGWWVQRGTSSHPWPSSSASLSIIEIWLGRTRGAAPPVLDDEPVPNLGVDLQPYLTETGRPERLTENDDTAFIGSYVLGLGFTLDADAAQDMIAADPRNADVLMPYIIGADLNRRPDTSAGRWVINFFDWPLDRAEHYERPLEQVRRLVKPERDRKKREVHKRLWWQYADRRVALYETVECMSHVLVTSRVSDLVIPARVPTGQVFAERLVVFASEGFADLAVLSSSMHQVWVMRYTSTMGTTLMYAPSDVFVTWPRPGSTAALTGLGKQLDTERRELMLGRSLGLTKLYNQVHDPSVTDPAIARLREIHEQIDYAMLDAYGWTDLKLDIGHHPTKIGIRWTVSPQARYELLDRLLIENHRRAATQRS